MQISVNDPQFETLLFSLLLFATIFLTARKKSAESNIFPTAVTTQLKGIAILAIICGHIGYFLAKDTEFLFPLSAGAGVGVNLFLFLSGYGLTISQLQKPLSIIQFYKKRLTRLFVPMWLVISFLLIAFYFFFNISFPQSLIIKNYLGIFPIADLYTSLNSVLWYFSLILFYYLIFPFSMTRPLQKISFVLIYYASILMLKLPPPIGKDVLDLYRLHLYAFPIGVFFALIPTLLKYEWYLNFFSKISSLFKKRNTIFAYGISFIFWALFAYFAVHSGVGGDKKTEQLISVMTILFAIVAMIWLPLKFNFLGLLGEYSYEIYLIHWPLLYHFDLLYKYLPPFISTYGYLFLFLGVGFCLNKLVSGLFKRSRF